jgi:hypothetical protein
MIALPVPAAKAAIIRHEHDFWRPQLRNGEVKRIAVRDCHTVGVRRVGCRVFVTGVFTEVEAGTGWQPMLSTASYTDTATVHDGRVRVRSTG